MGRNDSETFQRGAWLVTVTFTGSGEKQMLAGMMARRVSSKHLPSGIVQSHAWGFHPSVHSQHHYQISFLILRPRAKISSGPELTVSTERALGRKDLNREHECLTCIHISIGGANSSIKESTRHRMQCCRCSELCLGISKLKVKVKNNFSGT